jgi:hypothetical protein
MRELHTFTITYTKHSEEKGTVVTIEVFKDIEEYGWAIEKFFFMKKRGELTENKGNQNVAGKYNAGMIWIPTADIYMITSEGGKIFTKAREVFEFKRDVLMQ